MTDTQTLPSVPAGVAASAPRGRVLVVDDEPLKRVSLQIELSENGFEVYEAPDAQAAKRIFDAHPIDVVVSDVRMPGISGLDLLAYVKQIQPDVEVILMTAYYSSYANDYTPACFGDFPSLKAGDAYNFLLCAETSSTPSQYVGNSSMINAEGSNGLFIVRSYAQAGGSVPATLRKPGLPSSSGSFSNPPGPNPINGGIEIVPTLVYEGQGSSAPRRGVLPGLYGIPHNLGAAFDSRQQITAVEGLPGHVLIGVRCSTAAGSNGYRYAVDITGPWG